MSFFTLGVQYESGLISKNLSPVFMNFRNYLQIMNKLNYDTTLNSMNTMFRIAATPTDFGGSNGCEYLKKVRGKDEITIDYVIPEYKWKEYVIPVKATVVDRIIRYDTIPEKQQEFKQYLADAVTECYVQMKDKARSLKYNFNEEKMANDFDNVIDDFLRIDE